MHTKRGKRTARRTRRAGNRRFTAICVLAAIAALGLTAWMWKTLTRLPGEGVAVPAYVRQDFLTENRWSRPGIKLKKVKGVVIHYVGNPGTTAQANRDYFQSLSDGTAGVYASAHFVVGLEGEVVQCIPLTEISYASNSRNADTISIEVCHPGTDGKFSPVTYRRVVELTAWLCQKFHLTAEDVIRHYDVTGKICPKYYVDHPQAWKQFREDVKQKMDGGLWQKN